jgi:hypothetical protein
MTSRTFALAIPALICAVLLAASCISGDKPTPTPGGDTTKVTYPSKGLYVKDGLFYKSGKPYYGMGVNWFPMFNRVLNGENTLEQTYKAMDDLYENEVPFVRFAGPYWPVDWINYYQKDKDNYFRILDALVARAEKDSVGLIPSLFWYVSSIPDLFGEHMDAYNDDKSFTMQFIHSYTAEIVQRYKDSPAIWAWEFGNEFDLCVDIPGGGIPDVVPSMGTATVRDATRDRMTHEMMENAYRVFSSTVRQYDTARAIVTGNAEPRAAAWHLANQGNWTADNDNQYYTMFCQFNADPVDAVEIRGYCDDFPLGLTYPDQFMAKMMVFSKRAGKPLFVGEFHGGGGHADDKAEIQKRIDAIVDNNVQLSAYWVYNYNPAEADCNITFTNTRSFVFNMIHKANYIYKQKMAAYK